MRINNNIMAMNTHRMLGINQGGTSKSIEKLSSGYRINRAGDDAAGLAISEKMRAQVRGLNQASRNAQDGISLVQTAEGAMNETHAILQRMRELAVQGANDTNINEDREQLNNEISQLKLEVDRIANNTEYNTKKIMNYGAALQADGFEGIDQSVIITLNEEIPGWINDSMLVLEDRFGISHPDSPIKREMTVEYVNDDSVGYAAAMATSDSAASLTLKVNLAKVIDSNGDLVNKEVFDGLIAHEIMHAYQYTEMTKLIQDGSMDNDETWFMEGLAMLVQGGAPYIDELTGNIEDVSLDVDTAFGGSIEEYAKAYIALRTLHEITDGGINAIIDELEAGKTLDKAIEDTTQTDQGELLASGATANYATFKDFVDDLSVDGNFDTYLSTSTDFDKSSGTGSIVDGSDPTTPNNLSTADTILNNTGTATVYTHFNLSFTSDSTATGESDTPEQILFHIGSNQSQSLIMTTFDLTSNGLGIDSANVSTQSTSDSSITLIDSAIREVSSQRSTLGALQNRLEHTIKNLDTSSENLQASESRIRDVDMAAEMMGFTKNNILQQAAQSMLAQANQQPEGVLQLLR
ncbi:flagellinolysin [Clostridiaceae bacterium HSG29]|nr:flagellinolysin [Clostridiaceae bacterium HSG29]